jgi:transcriptional regulator with XRE-family HTH domain
MNEDIQRPAVTAATALLRQVRDDAALTQTELAHRAGVAPSTVSAYESGLRTPSLAAIDRLLAAVGKQLHLVAEPLAADLDAAIDAAQATPVPQRLERNAGSLDRIIKRLTSVPFVIEGALAALLQGAPVPVDALEIVVKQADLELLAKALTKMYARRWSNKWRQLGAARGGLPLKSLI